MKEGLSDGLPNPDEALLYADAGQCGFYKYSVGGTLNELNNAGYPISEIVVKQRERLGYGWSQAWKKS